MKSIEFDKLQGNMYWIGIKNRVLPKMIYFDDITETYNKHVPIFGKQLVLRTIKERYEGYISFFIEAENSQDAIDYVIKNFTKESNLKLV